VERNDVIVEQSDVIVESVQFSVVTATKPSQAISQADISQFGQLVSQAELVVPTFLAKPS